jgi:hypothetical protein
MVIQLTSFGLDAAGTGAAYDRFADAGASTIRQGVQTVTPALAMPVATIAVLAGFSIAMHFGVMDVVTGYWRFRGYSRCRAMFRQPWKATSLRDFWGVPGLAC